MNPDDIDSYEVLQAAHNELAAHRFLWGLVLMAAFVLATILLTIETKK